jgi:hypothetical protein
VRTNIADIGRADYDLSPPDKIERIPDDTAPEEVVRSGAITGCVGVEGLGLRRCLNHDAIVRTDGRQVSEFWGLTW